MKVPLAISATNSNLKVWRNRDCTNVSFPFNPFVLVRADKIRSYGTTPEKWNAVPGGDVQDYIRVEFDTLDELAKFRKDNSDIDRFIYYNGYTEQLYITQPDFIKDYAHNSDLTIMFWDIETRTDGEGRFPRASEKPILCIGYSIWKYRTDGTKEKIKEVIIDEYEDGPLQDKRILSTFVHAIDSEDPDIIAGYYSEEFDFPFFYERCKIMGVDMTGVSRDGREPWISNRGDIRIGGRIHYDMLKKVFKDQSLFGLKSKTLKIVARHYNVPLDEEADIELKEEIQNTFKLYKEDKEKLLRYQSADVVRTEHVGHVYIRNDIILAERLGVPLENTMNTYASFIPKMFVGRNMWTRRLINTETNFSKYNSQTGTIQKFKSKTGKELKYEGAVVGLYKQGFFPMTYKLDFTSMYPSSICTWNLGPDTTTLVDVKPYTGKYKFTQEGKFNWYRIPDANFECDLIVKVRNDVDGFLKKEIQMLWDERAQVKGEMKKVGYGTDEYNTLYSQQLAIKVILNSIYGFMGLNSTMYGDLITAIMVTAMCRWSTIRVIQKYEKELVELDTDGLALDIAVSEEETNKWLDELIQEKFKVDKNYMQMELETLGKAYFCKMKNYVVEEDGNITIHGSSLKSSRLCGFIDRARDLAIDYWFNNKPKEEVIFEAYDYDAVPFSSFEYRLTLSKDKSKYDDQTGQAVFLAKQVEEKTGQDVKEGTQISYVITKNQLTDDVFKPFYNKKGKGYNYTYVDYVEGVEELNRRYYDEQVDKMLERFAIKRVEQIDLFGYEEQPKLDTVPQDIGD